MEYRPIRYTVWFCRDIILVMFSLIFSVVLLTKRHGNNVLLWYMLNQSSTFVLYLRCYQHIN
jgi:hypothetical protein